MDMRAVCPSWRSAIAKPPPHAAFADHRFRPRNWIMVDLRSRNPDAGLFLHVHTGRFRRLRLPVLRDHFVLGASDGLVVLRDRGHPHLPHVLNPLTGDMLHFAAPLWEQLGSADELYTAVSGGPEPTLAVWRDWEYCTWHTVLYADPTSAEFTEEEAGTNVHSMVTFQGNIYYTDADGCVFQFVAPAEQFNHELVVIAKMQLHVDKQASCYLVESAGELLLVGHFDQTLKVFRVDVEHRLLEELKTIGSCCALFLGDERCVSVNADKLPSVDGDCIYIFQWVRTSRCSGRVVLVYSLTENTREVISYEPKLVANIHPVKSFHEEPWFPFTSHISDNRPHSLIQVLLDYCNEATLF